MEHSLYISDIAGEGGRERDEDAGDERAYEGAGESTRERNARLLVSRRGFLSGTLKTGAMVGLAGGALGTASRLVGCASQANPEPLTVSSSSLTTAEELEEMEEYASMLSLYASWDMPYGSIVFSNTPDMCVCLVPTDSASPLTSVYTLNPLTGESHRVIQYAVGTEDGFEVYDARGTSRGLIWVEANVFTRVWRVFMSPLYDGALTNIQQVDEGDGEWEMPSVAVVGDYGFWQVRPRLDGSHTLDNSLLKKAAFGGTMASVAFTSEGRFATPIYPLSDRLVITPRRDFNNLTHYELTLLNALTNSVEDTLCLQTGMKPVEAGYGTNGFCFSFDAIYDYGDGISNLGTYTPYEAVTNGKYQDRRWFAFVRVPTAAPCWCGNYFIVKSTTAVLGMDLGGARYCVLDVQEGADSYGEYLASTGTASTFVTYTNIDAHPIVGADRKVCNVRVWQRA